MAILGMPMAVAPRPMLLTLLLAGAAVSPHPRPPPPAAGNGGHLRRAFDDHDVDDTRAVTQLAGLRVFRRERVSAGGIEAGELDHHIARTTLALGDLSAATAHDGCAAVFLYGLSGFGGIASPGVGVGNDGAGDDVAFGHWLPSS